MLGWEIFAHAVAMVFRNFGQVLRITLGPALVAGIVAGTTFSLFAKTLTEPSVANSGQVILVGLLMMLTFWVCLLWVTVAWHRFILLEEYAKGLLPSFRFDRITAYFGTALAIGLMVGLPTIVLVLVLIPPSLQKPKFLVIPEVV